MPTVYGAIDLLKNELRNATIQNLGSPPSSPVVGQLYFNTSDGTLYYCSNAVGPVWTAAKAGAGITPASTVTTQAIGDTPTVGSGVNFAREDHKHGMPAFGTISAELTFGTPKADGVAATLARSDHTHGNPVHDAAAHSSIPLSALSVPTANVNYNAKQITNLADPVLSTDGATKQYVDNTVNGLSWKDPVRVASTANLALSGLTAIDGVTPVTGDRVLAKNQTTASANGVYTAAAGAWTRATDADVAAELEGMAVFVNEGTTQADTVWLMSTNSPLVVGTTSLTFVQFGAPAGYIGGAGLLLTGLTFDVGAGSGILVAADSIAVDPAVVPTIASVTAKADKTTTITAGNGLVGTGDLSANRTIDLVAGDTSLTVAADSVIVNTAVIATRAYVDAGTATVTRKYAAALTGTVSGETVTHNLNTRDVQVSVVNSASPWQSVEVDWEATTVNTLTVRFSPVLGAGFRVVVIG